MAYRQLFTGIQQTAMNASATLTAAMATAGILTDENIVLQFFNSTADDIFAKLQKTVEADNASLAEEQAKDAASGKSSGGGNRSNSGGSGGSGGSITVESARGLALKGGKFDGVTLGALFDMPASEAAEYGYGEGDRPGRQYVKWLASDKNNNEYTRRRAKVLIEAAQADGEDGE